MIPRDKYWIADYPNLDPDVDGVIIPDLFGEKTNITPVCIDTIALKYKIANCDIRAIFSIDEVRAGTRVLTSGVDYTVDLPNGEFTLNGTPLLQPSTTYYIIIEGDYAIDGVNWTAVEIKAVGDYGGGEAFSIDGGDVWTGSGGDMRFEVWGKDTLASNEELKINGWGASDTYFELRKAVGNTKIAQSFTTPAGNAFYLTRIRIRAMRKWGAPGGSIWLELHSDQVGTQMGTDSTLLDVATQLHTTGHVPRFFAWDQLGDISEILVDAKGYVNADTSLMDNGSDILKYVVNYRLNMADATLDLAAFAAYKAARTQEIAAYLDRETPFNQFLEKLEATQLFKFLPQLDGTHAPIHYVAGEPAGTPHLQEEDFLPGFSCERRLTTVKEKFKVLYGRDPTTNEYSIKEVESNIAKFFYRNEETLQIATYLKDAADATALANSYKALLEYPERWANFLVRNYGLDQIPTEKAKITRARGDNSGGSFDAVLFRIMKLRKAISEAVITFDAQLDSQTY